MMNRERGMATRTGVNKQGWESSDFPVACDRCYGENPYMRMLKENFGQQCRICFRPFTVFKWKGNKGIFKRTCVCNLCSKDKNICQVCTLDLQFGLPMDIRDKRCGKNGVNLINEDFVSTDNQKAKPAPPSLPPPPSTKANQKELVFVPQDTGSDEQGINALIHVQGQLLAEQVYDVVAAADELAKIAESQQKIEKIEGDSIDKVQNSQMQVHVEVNEPQN